MAFQLTDYIGLNRGGTPATAGGQTGTYYTGLISALAALIGVPLQSVLGAAPTGPTPYAYIDDSVNPAVFYIYNTLGSAYVAIGAGTAATQAQVDAGTNTTAFVTPATLAKKEAHFEVTNITSTVVSGSYVNVTGGTVVNDTQNSTIANGTFTVGSSDAGVWTLSLLVVESVTIPNMAVAIQVNGQNITYNATASNQVTSCGAVKKLAAGDVVTFLTFQNFGATATLDSQTSYAAVRIS